MPELGRATYFLVLDSQQFDAGLAEADAAATKITTSIGRKLGVVGTEAQAAGVEVNAAGTEMAAGFEKAGGAAATAGTEAKAGAAEMVTAARGAAVGTEQAAVGSTLAWGKMGTSIGAMGTKSFGVWKLAGLAAIYEVAKSGIDWLKETNAGQLQFNAALKATADVAGTSTKKLLEFSDSANSLATRGGRAAVLQMQKILLGFTNIRNEGTGSKAIFDRVMGAAEDIAARTGRSITTVAVALGKAFQDPVKYMNTLGRAGVTFNKGQQQVVAGLIAQGKPLQAQQYMLQLLSRYTGSATAQSKSFSGQLAIAKGHLAQSSALMVHAFIPSFKTLVGILEVTAGFLARHTTLVKDVTLAYLGWKVLMLGVGVGMKIFNSTLVQTTAGWLGIGRASTTSATEANAATVSMDASMGTLIEEVQVLQRALIRLGPAAEEGSAAAILSLRGVNTALAGTTVAAGEAAVAVETDMAAIGSSAGVAAGGIGMVRLGLLGIAGMVVTAAILLDIIPHSSAGQKDLDAAGLGFLGHTPVLGGLFTQSGRFGNYLRGKLGRGDITNQQHFGGPPSAPKGYDPGSYGQGLSTRANPAGYLKKGSAADRAFRREHPHGVHPRGAPHQSARYMKWQQYMKTHPGATYKQYQKYEKEQKQLYKALHPDKFTQSSDLLGAEGGQQWQQLQISYDRAQLTKSKGDDRRVLHQEYDFLNHILKTRKLSLDQKKTILDQMVSINSQIQSLDSQIAKSASPSLAKLLGPKWQQLDIQEQKAKQDGNLSKDKKKLQDEEDYIKQLLKNRKLSLESRQKLEHQLTAVEDKIKAINKKMASNAKDSQMSEMEAFNELQGTFFGQFAPNIFGSTPKGLTLGSQKVKQPTPHHGHGRTRHHAMGGVIHYARGGAVDTRIVREAPHYASHEARFHRSGLAYFEANSPTKERRGTDTVPAMLTPGELVLNRDQQRMLRSRLGMPVGGSPESLFREIQGGTNEHNSALVLRLAHHSLSMERGASRAPYRKDISTWLRQFQGMSKAQKDSAQNWWGTNYGEIRRGYAHGGPVGGPIKHTHHHTHVHHPVRGFVPPRGSISYIERQARRMGLDVGAVMGVASGEGLGGGIGDSGTSFGPWQLHRGGAYPRGAPSGEMAAQRWAWSHAGINYALQRIASVARGLHGRRAAMAIINRFERPANPMSDYNAYLRYVGNHGMGGPRMRQGRNAAPFSRNSVFERIDQGVDYLVKGAVHAVGAGRIASITGGMAGGTGTIIKERLSHPIKINGRTYYGIYYSEGASMVKTGQRVRAGQAVMGGGGVEIGFLDSRMRMPPLRGGLGAGTKPSRAGYDFAALISNLRSGRRTGFPPVFGHRRTVRRGNRWLMVPDTAGGGPMNMGRMIFPDVGGIEGLVPGMAPVSAPSAAADSVPAMLTPGEMVLNQSQQGLLRQKLGLQALTSPQQLFAALMNPQHYYTGGPVGTTTTYRPSRHRHHHPHVSAATAHHHPETQSYGPHYHSPHVSASTAHHHPETQSYGPHYHPSPSHDHPSTGHSYYVPAGRGVIPVSHARYLSWHRQLGVRPDTGFSLSGALGSVGGWFHDNLGRERNYGALGTTAVGFGHFVKSAGLGTGHLGKEFGVGNYNFWRGFGQPDSKYTKRSDKIAGHLIMQQQRMLEAGATAVAHPGRSPYNDLLTALMFVPLRRFMSGPIEGMDYGANLRTALARKMMRSSVFSGKLTAPGPGGVQFGPLRRNQVASGAEQHLKQLEESPLRQKMLAREAQKYLQSGGRLEKLLEKGSRFGVMGEALRATYGLNEKDFTTWLDTRFPSSKRRGQMHIPGSRGGGLGVVPRREKLAREAQHYLQTVDVFRGEGYDPFGIRAAGPFEAPQTTTFQSAAAHELEAHAALARDVGRTVHPMEWPNWVRNQLRNQGLLGKYLRRWGQSGGRGLPGAGGMGIVGTRRENMAIWNQTMKARRRAITHNPAAANMWQIPDAHLWRGGDPVAAIGHLNDYVLQYSQFSPWYNAMGLTMGYGSELEGSMFGRNISAAQLTGVKTLTSARNRVPSNLGLAIDAARHTHGTHLTPEMLREMSSGLGYAHVVPHINRLLREGAHGVGHSKLGLPGDILARGPKGPSYFHNIMHSLYPDLYPAHPVTIDTIAGDALIPGMAKLEKANLFKRDRHYGLFAEIYRQVGAKRGMLGKEAQASVWVPHRAFMSSTARGGTGNLGRLTGSVDWLDVFGQKYGARAQRMLARRIQGTGYGGLGIVGHERTPLNKSWGSGIAEILDDWSGEGALNAGVFNVRFGDNTNGVVKLLSNLLGRPRDKVANEILQAKVAHTLGAYVPDMMPLGENGFVMRTVKGDQGSSAWESHDQIYGSRAGHRLGLLDTLIGNTDRHGANWKLSDFGPVGFDADLLFRAAGSPFASHFESSMMTAYDYHYLDHAIPRLRSIFAGMNRSHDYEYLKDQWKYFKQNRAELRGHGDPLMLLRPEEQTPYYSGRVFGTQNPDLSELAEMARGYRQEHGIRSRRGSSDQIGSVSTHHHPETGMRWDSGEEAYHHTSGWTWWPDLGDYRRRSEITPPFMKGNKQIHGMGQNTRDMFHGLIEHFSPGDPNRRLAERAYRLLKIYPDARNISGGYHDAMSALGSIFGVDVPRNLLREGQGIDVRQRGLSGLMEKLHDRYHYPQDNKIPFFVPRGREDKLEFGQNTHDEIAAILANFLAEGGKGAARAGLGALQAGRNVSVMEWMHALWQEGNRPSALVRLKDKFPSRFSGGGTVGGSGNGDTVAAMLTPGELVLNSAQQVLLRKKLGLTSLGSPTQLFNEIGMRHYAAGGIVEGLDLGNIGVPSPYTTPSSLGYNTKRDIAKLVGIETRAREIDSQSPTGTLHYEQHNSYNEIPKDHFAEARQMKQAVHASFLT